MTCIAVNEEIIAVTKGLHIDCYDRDSEEHNIISLCNDNIQKDDNICDIVISSDGKYLAVITSISKKIFFYNLPKLKEVRTLVLPRSASKIRFTIDNSKLLVADKTGDCVIYNISTEDSGTKLLGHLSLLLNILQSEDGKYIITSDRDEKIRVTCYPNTYAIHTYCLGHKEFVNHIELLPHDVKYLVSTSGDGTIKCWNYENGTLCYSFNINCDVNNDNIQQEFKQHMDKMDIEVECLPVIYFTIMKLNDSCSIIAVCVHLIKKIFIYTLQSDNNKFIHKLIDTLDVYDFPSAIKFHNFLFFVYFNTSEVSEYKITPNNHQITCDFVKKIDVFKNIDIDSSKQLNNTNYIKVLYKRKYDNVQEYQERKKQRLGIME